MADADIALATTSFADFPYDREWIDAGLARRRGQLLVDDSTSPMVTIFDPGPGSGGVSFITGNVQCDGVAGVVDRYLAHSSSTESPYLALSLPSEAWATRILSDFDRFSALPRVTYRFGDARLDDMQSWQSRVHDGFQMRQIDRDLASRIDAEIDPDFKEFWTTPEEFVANSAGYCLMQGPQMVSVAYSALPIADRVTIAVATHPEFRGRGFSPLVCSPLVKYCLAHTIEPVYTTDESNAAARSVAVKLGFTDPVHHFWIGCARLP